MGIKNAENTDRYLSKIIMESNINNIEAEKKKARSKSKKRTGGGKQTDNIVFKSRARKKSLLAAPP